MDNVNLPVLTDIFQVKIKNDGSYQLVIKADVEICIDGQMSIKVNGDVNLTSVGDIALDVIDKTKAKIYLNSNKTPMMKHIKETCEQKLGEVDYEE